MVVRAYIKNSSGISYGNEITLTASPQLMPSEITSGVFCKSKLTLAFYWYNFG